MLAENRIACIKSVAAIFCRMHGHSRCPKVSGPLVSEPGIPDYPSRPKLFWRLVLNIAVECSFNFFQIQLNCFFSARPKTIPCRTGIDDGCAGLVNRKLPANYPDGFPLMTNFLEIGQPIHFTVSGTVFLEWSSFTSTHRAGRNQFATWILLQLKTLSLLIRVCEGIIDCHKIDILKQHSAWKILVKFLPSLLSLLVQQLFYRIFFVDRLNPR